MTVIAQAIDTQWTIFLSNMGGHDYLNISFTIYENFNLNTTTFDSRTNKNYVFNVNNLNLYQEIDVILGKSRLIEITSGNLQLSIGIGEYMDLNGDPLDIDAFFNQIISVINP